MNRLTLTLFFVALVMAASGWPSSDQILNFQGATHGWDDTNGVWRPFAVNGDGKMVTDAAISIGSVTVDPAAPPTSTSQQVLAAAPVPGAVTPLANRKSISIFNPSTTMTVWARLDGNVASAAAEPPSIPIPPLGFISTELDSSIGVGVAASVSTLVTVYQDGY